MTLASGRTGVTTVMESSTASNTITTVGRSMIGVREADRIRIGRRQFLHQPHHVVAEIAEQAGRHRRQLLGQRDAAFGDQRAQAPASGGSGQGLKASGLLRATRLISARVPAARQMRSGSSPMIE